MRFDDIIGNYNIKRQLRIASKAAFLNNTAIPHLLFAGAAGCGKTTMSKAVALSRDSNFLKIPPEGIKTSKDLYDILDELCVDGYDNYGRIVDVINPTIIFLDEIHKMPLRGQEVLGIAMEEWYIAMKSQYTGEIIERTLPKFTVIGATTLEGKLSKPFLDRFKMIFQFTTYNLEESIAIVKKHAEMKEIKITNEGAETIALRSRGVPRIMVRFLERTLDAITVNKIEIVDKTVALSVFEMMGIDSMGLTTNDIKLLKTLHKTGIPVGLDTLSIILNESQQTIKNTREPYLIQKGLIIRAPRGRVITNVGIEYLKEHGHIKSRKRFAHHSS